MDNFLNDEEEEIYGNKQNSNKIQRKWLIELIQYLS
jgi:hypothetical protein